MIKFVGMSFIKLEIIIHNMSFVKLNFRYIDFIYVYLIVYDFIM